MRYNIYKAIETKLFGYKLKPNNKKTRKSISYNLSYLLQRQLLQKKIKGFHVTCDETNNSPSDIISHLLNVDIKIIDLDNRVKNERYVVYPTSKG